MDVVLLTPTGNRPEGLALLAEYVAAQTYSGPLTWVIVDDCEPATRIPKVNSHTSPIRVRPHWRWKPGLNSQAACLRVGLQEVPVDACLLILEDDDVYLPGHVANLVDALQTTELAGERVTRYYNVATNRARTLPSARHASLSSTGVRGSGIDALRAICGASTKMIDVKLWQGFRGPRRLLETANVVGIKGLPGRPGIGVGHHSTFGERDQGDQLREWIGDLADNYAPFRRAAA